MKMNDSTNKRMPRFVSAETAVFSNNGAIYDSPGHSSPIGATYDSPGQRPGFGPLGYSALKGRHNRCSAPSGLGIFSDTGPRALPWAIVSCPVGAEEKCHTGKRAVLEKQVNANLEGMGYGG